MVIFSVFAVVMLEIESAVGQIVRIKLVLLGASNGRNTRVLLLVAEVLFNDVE